VINIKKIKPFITIGILDLKAFSLNHSNLLKRETEKAGSLYLLKEMLKTDAFSLEYHSTNKPYLKDRTEHISISHSHDKLAIIINEKENTGIDIELIRDKVLKIRHKFLNEKEMSLASDNVELLITVWAAKEAMYKVYGLKELDFMKNLSVMEFDNTVFFGKIDSGSFKKQYLLVSENIEDYKMVYVLNEL